MKTPESNIPPKWPLRFLRWVIKVDYLEEIEGDMEEIFQDYLDQYSPKKARQKYAWDTLKLLRPSLLKNMPSPESFIPSAMIKHNFLISYRSFLRNKTSFLINLIGLASGLACVLLIYLWVNDEMSMDKFHEKDSQLYQVMVNFHLPSRIDTWEVTPAPMGEAMIEEIPEIEATAMISSKEENPEGVLSVVDKDLTAQGLYASENFFDIFSFDLLEGSSKHVLADKSNIVISEELAIRLFNSTKNIIGKTIEWKHPYVGGVFSVSGVFETLPTNSTEEFDFILSMDVFLAAHEWAKKWDGNSVETFVILKEGTNIDDLNARIAPFLSSKTPDTHFTTFVQQYSQRYLYNRYEEGEIAGGKIDYVRLFSMIGLFILLLACINFMNLLKRPQSFRQLTMLRS